jgi:hypothetical protein
MKDSTVVAANQLPFKLKLCAISDSVDADTDIP